MTIRGAWTSSVLIAMLGGAVPAQARVLGGGPAATDCYAAFDGVTAARRGIVECRDGASCDADGIADCRCTFQVRVCAHVSDETLPECTPRGIATIAPRGRNRNLLAALPRTPVTAETCGEPNAVVVILRTMGRRGRLAPRTLKLKLRAAAQGTPSRRDVDRLVLRCLPDPSVAACPATTTTTLPSCPPNSDGGPSELSFTVADRGSDLDIGVSGKSHNFIVPARSRLRFCLAGCDATTQPSCRGIGTTGTIANSLNGPTFGPPLPLFSAGVPVCVVNRFEAATIEAQVNVRDGTFDATATPIHLVADTYQSVATAVCPRCIDGKCDGGRSEGTRCTVDGVVVINNPPTIVNVSYPVSRDCLPSSSLLGSPEVSLPLTSDTSVLDGSATSAGFPCPGQTAHDACGSAACSASCTDETDAKGGLNQSCCGNRRTPCFPTDAATGVGRIERRGATTPPVPAWPDVTYPKSNTAVLVATFCIPATGATLVDGTAGLPGPGALILPGVQEWVR